MEKMSKLQYGVIFLCFVMNMCDGMDVMIVSYSAKAISAQWSVTAENFGVVFSAGLLGMASGAILLAPIADKIGRKKLVLFSLVVMGLSSFLTGFVHSLVWLTVARLFTGLGVGCMLACINALTAEYSSIKMKSFWVSFVGAGYPTGAVICGFIAHPIISIYGWRSLFLTAGALTLLVVPIAWIYVQESLDFLLKKQPPKALERANNLLLKMKKEALQVLPLQSVSTTSSSLAKLFEGNLRSATGYLWVAFFFCFATLYFLTSWIPKLASDFGMSDALAIYAGLAFNLGSLFGILSQGYLSTKLGIKGVISVFLVSTGVLMGLFGFVSSSLLLLTLFAAIGFGMQGGFIGLYAVSAHLYETTIRSTGIGWAIGLGRLGAIIGPMLGGLLISYNIPTHLNFIVFSIPCALAGIATLFIRIK